MSVAGSITTTVNTQGTIDGFCVWSQRYIVFSCFLNILVFGHRWFLHGAFDVVYNYYCCSNKKWVTFWSQVCRMSAWIEFNGMLINFCGLAMCVLSSGDVHNAVLGHPHSPHLAYGFALGRFAPRHRRNHPLGPVGRVHQVLKAMGPWLSGPPTFSWKFSLQRQESECKYFF
jgi:hypothetical protein